MALNRKYAALPDLDSAPDIYETPELTDDNSTLPTGTIRSQSSSSSYKDFDEDEDESPGISRSRLHPDEARSHFSPAQIDARDVDFSDRVTGKRKSYKASTRRQRKREDGTDILGDLSDEEDGESLDRKLARLRRETEEAKEELAKRNNDIKYAAGMPEEVDFIHGADGASTLSMLLDNISAKSGGIGRNATSRLVTLLGSSLKNSAPSDIGPIMQKDGEATTYTVTYAPDFPQSHALARAADFDSRLTILEKALGVNTATLPALDSKRLPVALLPSLDRLQRQLSVLTETSPASLDTISRRVRALTQETERLDEARRSAKTAQEELRASTGDATAKVEDEEDVDTEQVAKINALYGTLATIENLSPLLPSLLDRLRSLRAIHTDAATASVNLDKVVKRQEDMSNDIKRWREGLEKVEQAMKQGERTMGGNMKVIEGWVKDLEARMERL